MYFIGDEEIAALEKLFAKKRLYRYQAAYESECDLFEKEFSLYSQSKHALLLSSGTNALALSLLASGLQAGDEVLVPTYTFVATAAAVIHAGGIPVLVNIDCNLSMNFEEAQKKITAKTKAIILVHMDGLVANVEAASIFCKKNSLVFIEDAAQAIGASYQHKKIGSFGDLGCYSLNENKNISCGEGGILITNTRAYYEKVFCLHDGPAQFNPLKKDFFTETKAFMGLSMRVSEIQGAIMRVQLTRLEFILSELRKRKKIILEALSTNENFICAQGYSKEGECASSLHLQFTDKEKSVFWIKKINGVGFAFMPVTSRPAHASWKWTHLLGESAHLQPGLNPYMNSEKKYNYPLIDYLESVEILTNTFKMDIDIHLSLEETQKKAELLAQVLSS